MEYVLSPKKIKVLEKQHKNTAEFIPEKHIALIPEADVQTKAGASSLPNACGAAIFCIFSFLNNSALVEFSVEYYIKKYF